jgi:hypothetical protein
MCESFHMEFDKGIIFTTLAHHDLFSNISFAYVVVVVAATAVVVTKEISFHSQKKK